MKPAINIFWFRRDLRLDDNAGLYHALKSGKPVLPLFIFDRNILNELEEKSDRRVEFIYQSLDHMQTSLIKKQSSLEVRYGFPVDIFRQLSEEFDMGTVFSNHDYEPYALTRDAEISSLLKACHVEWKSFKDQVIFEKNEVVKDDGKPYTIFTPYSRKWKARASDLSFNSYPSKELLSNFYQNAGGNWPSLESMGFGAGNIKFPSSTVKEDVIRNYSKQRDFPALNATSRLSIHLRFGTISIRELAREAGSLNETFLNELIWREFYQMILWHFPRVVHQSFKPEYDKIQWRNDEREFEAWCKGLTGYPIVDAGMRELNETGFMHNRLRMITASFLTKHLLVDWRWGEAYFARKLLDYELASNNGGWQWAASSGCDAVPYFRIFNPAIQTKKFDPGLRYVRKWVPEFEGFNYPKPIVEHEFARQRCLDVYGGALKNSVGKL